MLNIRLYTFFFKKNIKIGLFIDYIFKKTIQTFLKNNLIWAGLFLLEKFFIEYISRFIFNSIFLNFFKKHDNNIFNLIFIFYIILLFMLYTYIY